MNDDDDADDFEDNPEDDESQDISGAQALTNKEINAEIDRLLAEYRPERYNANELDWLAPVFKQVNKLVGDSMTAEEILRDYVTRRVVRREGDSTKRPNAVLRNIVRTNQYPLGWGEDNWAEMFIDISHAPLSIPKRENGEIVKGKQVRVRFGSMTRDDWVEWVNGMHRTADEKHRSIIEAADGGERIRKLMDEQDVNRTDQLRFEP